MKRKLILYLSLSLTAAVHAQILIVKDAESLQPLEHVTVYSRGLALYASTDTNGSADITSFAGAPRIHVERAGYRPVVTSYRQLSEMHFALFLVQIPFEMREMIVSASRWEQEKKDVPNKVLSIRPPDAALQNPQTAADLLSSSGEIFMQKSQLGGGSPMIRGFAANRLLITVDGIRMNTAIFRSGNLQNVISLDPLSVERTEVVFGPGAVIYGSDAISAVMGFYTLNPPFSQGGKTHFSGSGMLRTSSANFEKTGHVDFAIGFRNVSFLTSATVTDYGDQRMGSHGPEDYLRLHYVKTILGKDSTVANPDPLKQVPSGYSQFNLMQKIRFKPNERWEFTLGVHYSSTSDYSRYDRLIRYRGDHLRSAQWYYGPQTWSMNALHFMYIGQNKAFDLMQGSVAYHFFKESRHDRDFGDTELRHRTETVDAFTANLDFEKQWQEKHQLFYGAEVVLDGVGSTGENEDIASGTAVRGPSRYPDGSAWNSYAAYVHYRYTASLWLAIQSGLRFNQVTLDAVFDTTFYPFPFTEEHMNPRALTGSLGLAITPEPASQIRVLFSTGFRAPNIDDMGKVFDSEPGSVVVPNPDLKPEYAYNGELGISKVFGTLFTIDVSGYYTLLSDAMVRRNYTLGGQDSILYDGTLSRVQALQNSAQAHVWGIEASVKIGLPFGFAVASRFNYQKGEEELDDGSLAPLRHAGPWFGDTHVTCTAGRFKADLYGVYNGTISNRNLAPEEQGKAYMYACDPDGNPYAPGWYTLNFKISLELSRFMMLYMGIENITDQRYRPYSSGITAPGRNFIAAVKTMF